MGKKTNEPITRFLEKVVKTEACWYWTGAIASNYGRFWDGEKIDNAHRYSYRYYRGKIPDSYVVMHLCDTPLCVNPGHLEVGTQKQNLQDMYAKGRNRSIDTYEQQAGAKHWTKRAKV